MMSAPQQPTIPYEPQTDLQNSRRCGAAALSMVYRSLGREVAQAEIWSKIARPNQRGSLTASTHLMTQDALSRGFAALAIQAKHPLQALRICQENNIRAILNHRLKADDPAGHYSVLVGIDGEHVILHDPYYGPSRRVSHVELLEFWRPRYLNAEIIGNALIGIAAYSAVRPSCSVCGTATPVGVACPRCGKPIPLQPAALLGCMGANCMGRWWNYLCCPSCDFTWTFHLSGPEAAAPAAGAEEDAVDLNPLFAELDKFCNHILSLPAAANHPDVRKQIDFLRASKDKLRLAQSEQLMYRKTHRAQLAQLLEKFRQEEEAILKQREELARPAPPLDGNALGQALLKDLGLTDQAKPRLRDADRAPIPSSPSATSKTPSKPATAGRIGEKRAAPPSVDPRPAPGGRSQPADDDFDSLGLPT